jgi:hypothetical protein
MRILLLAAAGACLCYAQQPCAWLNEATASGVLESAAHVTSAKSSCQFNAKTGTLRIEVSVTPDAAKRFAELKASCGGGATSLKAIGNEAVACPGTGSEQIAGRVRDQLFIITLTMKGFSQEAISGKGRLVAEQVSGNLF